MPLRSAASIRLMPAGKEPFPRDRSGGGGLSRYFLQYRQSPGLAGTLIVVLLAVFVLVNCGEAQAEAETLVQLYSREVPRLQKNASALTYHEIPINRADPRAEDPLVRLADYGIAGEEYYSRADGLNAPYHRCICSGSADLKARKIVAEKLQKVNARLTGLGLELFVFDAYRPVSCQRALWNYFIAEAERILGAASREKLIEYAGKYCSDPTNYDPYNYKTWPTHLTGGAVDLCLRRKADGELLFMGGIFDDASELSNTVWFEKERSSAAPAQAASIQTTFDRRSASAIEAMRNRRLLYWVMHEEGFENFSSEWWHFDYGNQMWVKNRQDGSKEQAFFGAI